MTELATELLVVAAGAGGYASLGGVRAAMARAARLLELDAPPAVAPMRARSQAGGATGACRPVGRRTRRYAERRSVTVAA